MTLPAPRFDSAAGDGRINPMEGEGTMTIQEIAEALGLDMDEAWRRLEGWIVPMSSTDQLKPADVSLVRAILAAE